MDLRPACTDTGPILSVATHRFIHVAETARRGTPESPTTSKAAEEERLALGLAVEGSRAFGSPSAFAPSLALAAVK